MPRSRQSKPYSQHKATRTILFGHFAESSKGYATGTRVRRTLPNADQAQSPPFTRDMPLFEENADNRKRALPGR